MSDTPSNPLEGLLTEFALGPAWARSKSEPALKHTFETKERDYQPRRSDDRGPRRDSGRDPRSQRDDRDRQGGGNRRDVQKRGDRNSHFQREEIIAPAEGVSLSISPDRTALQILCKEIQQIARVYPLFDIAQTILTERSRCRAHFEISEKNDPFYISKFDEALFLTKEEALRHFLDSPLKNRFVEESHVEVEPPKGNFQTIARCGISGKLLGPPNYHGYQTEIRRIHRECFPEMPFESYSSKIRTERSEETVSAWLESMKQQTRWRILSSAESAAIVSEAAAAKQAATAPPVEEVKPELEVTETLCEADNPKEISHEITEEVLDAEVELTPGDSELVTEETAPAEQAEDFKWFTDRSEFERALIAEVLPKAFRTSRKAKVSAAIPARNLSPGLLVRLKSTGSHHRKHPAILIPDLCKMLEAEHMPVFKRKGKLYTGPARPCALALDAVLAERPGQMVTWIRENSPAKLEGLWQAMLPEGASAPPQGYAADLFWLLQQGHILLYTDDTLVVQDPPKPPEPKKPKGPKPKKPKQEVIANGDSTVLTEELVETPAQTPSSDLEEVSPATEEISTELPVVEVSETAVEDLTPTPSEEASL